MKTLPRLLILSLSILIACGPRTTHQQIARELSSAKKYDLARAEYQKHIDARLSIKNRPEWENPYIYLLDIGDLWLEEGQPTTALENYALAEAQGVKESWVLDRYRHTAAWYENQGNLPAALELLRKHASRDPDLFNIIMDRIAKKIVSAEKNK